MKTFWFLVVFVFPWFYLAYLIWRSHLQNTFRVEPNNRERLVLQNALTGGIAVLRPGAHPRGPWWKELARVDLNREPVAVPGEGRPSDEVKTSDGIRLHVDYRYDIITGRPFDDVTGRLTVKPDAVDAVQDHVVILATTRIDFADREKRVQEIVENTLEAVFGWYQADALMTPEDFAKKETLQVPKDRLCGPDNTSRPDDVLAENVQNPAKLYEQLAKCVQELANRDLLFVGINIVDFRITNLRFLDPRLQEALEDKKRKQKLREAAKEAQRDGMNLTDREAFAVGTDQFGTVALAEAGQKFGESLADGLRKFGKG